MLMKLACWRLLFHVEASVKVSVAVSICLDLPQPLVQARLIDQVLVFTLLSYVASFKYDNLVGVNERRQPMRNYERGLFAVAFANGIEDHRFGLAIANVSPSRGLWCVIRPSSRMRMAGSRTKARAMAIRWRWPPDRFTPRSPMTVS